MLDSILGKLFGTKHERDLKKLAPVVDEMNRHVEEVKNLTDEELRGKTAEFKALLKDGATLDEILPRAFACVKEACVRLLGTSWDVCRIPTTWDMIPYDVQLMGAAALYEGKIAEMATGEGKTLVATMPLYLNALAGRGVHLVTVNDYLAKRDSQWMGKIYEFLGMTVGCIQNEMGPQERRQAYACDITYGTNNEFGFDYLRDNMAIRMEDRVQRGHYYAIVDEVDSVLIDEARTPLIISGPVAQSNQMYDELRPVVERLVKNQTVLVNQLISEAEELIKSGDSEYEVGSRLLQVSRGSPKNKRFLKLMTDGRLKKLVQKMELEHIRDKKIGELDEGLFFAIDEKRNSVDLSEKGRDSLSPKDRNLFVLPDLSVEIEIIESDGQLSPKEKVIKKDEIHRLYGERSEKIHNIFQLLKAYTLFEKDVEYVVKDGKVLIVDEFTGRLMPGRRYSDGLHQALEAKENVKVEGETQTLATITLQNYFRLYEKLAGMTGTAETEAPEFFQIYKLDVVVIPTNRPVRRVDYEDLIYRTKREKYNKIIEEIEALYKQKRPVLIGTVSVEVSETLSRLLKRKGIPHSVLNAKYHQMEAEIVAKAGQPGAVTIATNMAGRGTDIRLGAGVVKCSSCCIECSDNCSECAETLKREKCLEEVPCGLHIIGTERHESRRIDRQLRGRSGRQGDPGSSSFYLSLEDDLMRLFGSERIASVMERMGVQEGDVIEHPLVTKAIERAQKRVEAYNFDIRKHLLEYDNVMNQQREVIYGLRLSVLEGGDLSEEMMRLIEDVVRDKAERMLDKKLPSDEWEIEEFAEELALIFLSPFQFKEFMETRVSWEEAVEHFTAEAKEAYKRKEAEISPPLMREIERYVYLMIIDEKWKDHLHEVDILKEGISLRAYGQKDPLLEYKSEAFRMFMEMTQQISEDTLKRIMRTTLRREPEPVPTRVPETRELSHASVSAFGGEVPAAAWAPKAQPKHLVKVGRNDPCPCGSGKKFKRCHGA
ncbi:MAG: preprotein translocase subunit SecA [Candidatus Eisenbacteria bacterium]|nr:preprotein translocase subunit SecA [Candidatus Eisenbacteria bacterium]